MICESDLDGGRERAEIDAGAREKCETSHLAPQGGSSYILVVFQTSL